MAQQSSSAHLRVGEGVGAGQVRHTQSFQGRITASILLTAMAVLSVGCTLFMVEQGRMDHASLRRIDTNVAAFIAASVSDPLASGRPAATAAVLSPLHALAVVERVEVRDRHGVSVARYASRTRDARPTLSWTTPVYASGHYVGSVLLETRSAAPTATAPRYLAMGGALFFAAMGLALFLGRWLAARITGPVARLSAMMEQVGRSGGFAHRLEPLADDELGRLTESFNDLLAKLHHNDLILRGAMSDLVEARDAAETANLQKSQFLANVSHEIRTPLNGVLAMAQVMELSGLDREQRERLDVIRQSGESLLAILNDILDVSKIEAGKLELELVDFDIVETIETAASGFAAMAQHKGLDFSIDIAPEAMGARRGDAARIRQIICNLFSNAVKFTEAGAVRVRVSEVDVDGEPMLDIAVSDTGLGVAADKLPLLFKKFSQVDASTTRRFGGTGLGLAICAELAALMGGRVWVESEFGKGSTFQVRLPLPRVHAEPRRPVVHEPEAQPLEPANFRVLAAEDNATNQLVLTTVMQVFGFELVLVGDGQQAVDAWAQGGFDVILMDIQMPVMDGIAATRAIRAREAASGRARTPIIALSANALVHQVKEYLAAGMDCHVAKPIELPKLQAALEQVLLEQDGEASTVAA